MMLENFKKIWETQKKVKKLKIQDIMTHSMVMVAWDF